MELSQSKSDLFWDHLSNIRNYFAHIWYVFKYIGFVLAFDQIDIYLPPESDKSIKVVWICLDLHGFVPLLEYLDWHDVHFALQILTH